MPGEELRNLIGVSRGSSDLTDKFLKANEHWRPHAVDSTQLIEKSEGGRRGFG